MAPTKFIFFVNCQTFFSLFIIEISVWRTSVLCWRAAGRAASSVAAGERTDRDGEEERDLSICPEF